VKKKYFYVSLKGKDKANDRVVGTVTEEKDGKLVIKDGDQIVASFWLGEVQGWQSSELPSN